MLLSFPAYAITYDLRDVVIADYGIFHSSEDTGRIDPINGGPRAPTGWLDIEGNTISDWDIETQMNGSGVNLTPDSPRALARFDSPTTISVSTKGTPSHE